MFVRRCALVAFVFAGFAVVVAPAAHAASITPVCDSFAIDANGNPTGNALSTGNALPPLTIPSLGSGADHVPTGTKFPVATASGPVSLPSATTVMFGGNPLNLTINEIKNITLHFKISGAAAVSQPTLSGGNVLGATAVATTTSLTLTLPGSQTGSTVPKGSAFFPGGSTFTTPALSLNVTAPNTPGTISTSVESLTLMAKVTTGPTSLGVALECSVNANTIGSVSVVQPGAPVALDDKAETGTGKPVTIDVLKNDLPNDQGQPPDPSTLSIIKNPTHGLASVTSDHKVVYAPGASFVAGTTDTFQYQVCDPSGSDAVTTTTSEPELTAPGGQSAATVTLKCDPGVVTVTNSDVVVAATSTTAPPTTVAPTELPKTGGSSWPAAAIGVGLSLLGAALLLVVRRPRSFALRDRE